MQAISKSRWAIVRKDLKTIKRNTLPDWNKIKPTNFIRSYNQDTQTVTFKNGSEIIFFGENYDDDKELTRWRGLSVNGFLLDEPKCSRHLLTKPSNGPVAGQSLNGPLIPTLNRLHWYYVPQPE